MKYNSFRSWTILSALVAVFVISGCLKGDFDEAPSNIPEITNDQIITFDEMLSYIKVGQITNLPSDKYLEAVVAADDKSGNLFKILILHDLRGDKGISFSLDENELHALYPVGQVVYVSLKNLAIGYYEGLPTLGVNGGSSVDRVPANLIRPAIIKAGRSVEVVPRKVKFSELSSDNYNTLIELDNMQFETANANTTYADANPANPLSINHNVVDCDGHRTILRNSGFADFAGLPVPTGNGKLICVYSWFRNDAQLLIRDTTDVQFYGARCDGTGGGSTGERIRIEDLRKQFTGSDVSFSDGYIQGVVISDVANKNTNGNNIVIQDEDYGVLIRFKSPINIPLNTEIKVGLKGGLMSLFNGLLQVQNLENANVEIIANNKTVVPKTLTIGQFDLSKHESTLVKVENVTLSGGTKFSDKIKANDGTGSIDFFTNAAATFASNPIPSGAVTIVGFLGQFNVPQLSIRNLNDISGGEPCDLSNPDLDCDGDGVPNGLDCAPEDPSIYPGAPCNDGNPDTFNDRYDDNCNCVGSEGGGELFEDFSGQTSDKDVVIPGWDNVAVKGDRVWLAKYFGGEDNYYAQATAFGNTGPADMETWLVTPVIDTDVASEFSLRTSFQSWVHDGLSIWVTTDYTGNPATTTWVEVQGLRIATQGDTNQSWVPSGTVDLKSYGQKLRIGFKHVGSQSQNTTSYRIDDISVK